MADRLEANFAEGPAVSAPPRAHRQRLRTSNMLERLSEELKRRARVAGVFPNDASLLRLVSAILMEISDEWEANRKYLTMGPSRPARLQLGNLQKGGCTIQVSAYSMAGMQ